MDDNRCVCCGKIIPEGRMVCPLCESKQIKMGMILQSIRATKEDIDNAYSFMGVDNDD